MKKTISLSLIFAIVALMLSFNANAQKKKEFKGSVIYDITYAGTMEAATLAQMPKTTTYKIFGNKFMYEVAQGPTVMTFITNGDSKTKLMLLDVMGQKFVIKTSKEEVEKALLDTVKTPTPKIQYLNDTKEILGYKVKKAESTIIGNEGADTVKIVYWYTEEFDMSQANSISDNFKGINGIPLQFIVYTKGIEMNYLAKEVKKGGVKDTDFLQPADYKETTMEELMNMFGGGGEEE